MAEQRAVDAVLHSRGELLATLDVEDETAFREHLDENAEGDVSVEWDDAAAEVTVFVNGWGTTLTFPFTLGELWEVLDELDEAAGEDAEATEENQQT